MVKGWLLIVLGLFVFFLIVLISVKIFIVEYKEWKEKEKGNLILNVFLISLGILIDCIELFWAMFLGGLALLIGGLVLLK